MWKMEKCKIWRIVPNGEFCRVQESVTKQMIFDPSDSHYIENIPKARTLF